MGELLLSGLKRLPKAGIVRSLRKIALPLFSFSSLELMKEMMIGMMVAEFRDIKIQLGMMMLIF